MLRHQDRAFYFKLGVDEHFAKLSPGVQLTLDLTRHLCADPAIAMADSTANPDHPMINPIWRGRLAIGDVLIPLRPRDPVVPLVRGALSLRSVIREPARRARSFHPSTPGKSPGEIVMNSVTEVAPVITAANNALKRDFPLKPFAIRHKLAGHPLLTLPRIAQLASELPRDLIEYNSGKVAISQDPDAIPSVDLDPVEVVKRIETAGAWMVLKRVENSPEYRRCWKTRCCRWRGRAVSTACWTPASNSSKVSCSCRRRIRPRRSISTARTISSSISTAKSSSRSSTTTTAPSSATTRSSAR